MSVPRVISRVNAAPIVEKLPETHGNGVRTVTVFIRTHYGRHGEPFSDQNTLDFRIVDILSQNFSGDDTPDPCRSAPVLGPRHQFPLDSPTFPKFVPVLRNNDCGVLRNGPTSKLQWAYTPTNPSCHE